MIHEIGVELQSKLRARGAPFAVLDREQSPATTTFARERIVIEHDEGGDSFGPVRSQRPNPKHVMTRSIGAKISIYAKSPKAGALPFEHRRRAEHTLDLVLVAMHEIALERKNTWTPKGGRFFLPPDLADSEQAAGAAYELTFTFDRGVFVQTWKGEIAPTASIGEGGIGIKSCTHVRLDPNGEPETACGECGAIDDEDDEEDDNG